MSVETEIDTALTITGYKQGLSLKAAAAIQKAFGSACDELVRQFINGNRHSQEREEFLQYDLELLADKYSLTNEETVRRFGFRMEVMRILGFTDGHGMDIHRGVIAAGTREIRTILGLGMSVRDCL